MPTSWRTRMPRSRLSRPQRHNLQRNGVIFFVLKYLCLLHNITQFNIYHNSFFYMHSCVYLIVAFLFMYIFFIFYIFFSSSILIPILKKIQFFFIFHILIFAIFYVWYFLYIVCIFPFLFNNFSVEVFEDEISKLKKSLEAEAVQHAEAVNQGSIKFNSSGLSIKT